MGLVYSIPWVDRVTSFRSNSTKPSLLCTLSERTTHAEFRLRREVITEWSEQDGIVPMSIYLQFEDAICILRVISTKTKSFHAWA